MWPSRSTSRVAALMGALACSCAPESGSSDGSVGGGTPAGGSGASSSTETASGGAAQFMTTTSTGGSGANDCNPALTGVVRDFKAWNDGAGHPDFERYGGEGLKGIVEPVLGADHKPVYAHPGPTEHTTGPAEFDQWYRDVAGVNQSFPFTILGQVTPEGAFVYDNGMFFPIDGQGFGNEGQAHNFGFTFELHMEFAYKGGEVFTFSGDDDLWVFINDRLAIDLGGLHPEQSVVLDVDAAAASLGLVVGETYPLDLFHAERHTNESNFRIESTLSFTNCDPIVY
jgi:fibro-slime domain-containing protein